MGYVGQDGEKAGLRHGGTYWAEIGMGKNLIISEMERGKRI